MLTVAVAAANAEPAQGAHLLAEVEQEGRLAAERLRGQDCGGVGRAYRRRAPAV